MLCRWKACIFDASPFELDECRVASANSFPAFETLVEADGEKSCWRNQCPTYPWPVACFGSGLLRSSFASARAIFERQTSSACRGQPAGPR